MRTTRSWTHPPPPWGRDLTRWATFCRTVERRIWMLRAAEGHEGWQAFGLPLPEAEPPRPRLPVGRTMPVPTTPRNARTGRWQRRGGG